ncbi:MAG: amidohydrolase family protein [Pseudomonadaceae bacterium]|nr:amidohydrolase family protein [Pseudomonadaceae bacterium]
MKSCDLIISAPWVLPVAPENAALSEHSVAISGETIIAIGLTDDILQNYSAADHLKLTHHIVLPGLINTHCHSAMTLLRGAGEDQPLKAWLEETIWPLEAAVMNDEYVTLGTQLAVAEMLLCGTTTFSDMYFLPEKVAEVCLDIGIRAQLSFPIIEFANAWSSSADDALDKGLALHDQLKDNKLVHVALGPHSGYSLSAAELEHIAEVGLRQNLPIQIHLHETAQEVADAHQSMGQSWIERCAEIGMLGSHVQAVHMTQVSEAELKLIADTDTRVVHCPTSNLKLASGYCPTTALREAGVTVALGTDGAASNNRLNLFAEARMASLLAKHAGQNAAAATAQEMLYMATMGGARALGMESVTGSLEAGKAADLIAVDINSLGMLPMYNPFAALIHGDAGNAVSHTYVAGRALVADGQLTPDSITNLAQRVQSWHAVRRPI